jgi:hypothetical protein
MALNQALQGAGQGAAAGSAFGPWGAAVGGVAGGVLGALQDDPAEIRRRMMQDYQDQIAGATTRYGAGVDGVKQGYNALGGLTNTLESQGAYQGALGALDPTKYNVNAPTYDTTKTLDVVNQYLDPSMNLAIKEAGDQIQASAAGRGGLYSGSTGDKLTKSAADTVSKYWGDAFDRAQGELNRGNAITGQQFGADMTTGKYNLGLDEANIGLKKASYDDYMGNFDTANQLELDKIATIFGVDTQTANAILQAGMGEGTDDGFMNQLLGGLEGAGRAYSRVRGK